MTEIEIKSLKTQLELLKQINDDDKRIWSNEWLD